VMDTKRYFGMDVGTYRRGEGTKKQRAKLDKIFARYGPHYKDDISIDCNAKAALSQATGVIIGEGDTLDAVVDRVRDDPRAAPILALMKHLEEARQTAWRGRCRACNGGRGKKVATRRPPTGRPRMG
jgi:hypothetical protein